MGRARQSCFGNRAQVSRCGRSGGAMNQACYHSRALHSSDIAQVRGVASAGGLRSVSERFVARALSPQFLRFSVRSRYHGQGAGQCSRLSGFPSSLECRAFSGKRVRGRRERFRSSNLVVEQTAPTEPFGVSGGDLKVGAAAHHGCSKPRAGWSLASACLISGGLLSSSPATA